MTDGIDKHVSRPYVEVCTTSKGLPDLRNLPINLDRALLLVPEELERSYIDLGTLEQSLVGRNKDYIWFQTNFPNNCRDTISNIDPETLITQYVDFDVVYIVNKDSECMPDFHCSIQLPKRDGWDVEDIKSRALDRQGIAEFYV